MAVCRERFVVFLKSVWWQLKTTVNTVGDKYKGSVYSTCVCVNSEYVYQVFQDFSLQLVVLHLN